MSKVKIIADSTCDLPENLIKKHNIGIIPLNIIFEDEVRQQYINITNEEFYERLEAGEEISTGVPSPKVIKEIIEAGLEESEEVLIITLSSKLSGMFQTTSLVVRQFFDEKVTVVDSLCGTIETGLVVLEAARKASAGKSIEEILTYLDETLIPHSHLISYAETLKYLRRSGRISRLTHLMGTVLRIKPIFHIEEGEIVSSGKVMLWQDIIAAIKKLMAKMAGNQIVETMFIAHSGNPEKCQELIDYMKSLPNAPKEVLMAEVGPVVGVHVGPNTFGFVWIGNYYPEWFEHL
ncbi:MAG: DegV family protein [Asgard group archaeon]|nr:DegV family protein [Asgard group archaeon]